MGNPHSSAKKAQLGTVIAGHLCVSDASKQLSILVRLLRGLGNEPCGAKRPSSDPPAAGPENQVPIFFGSSALNPASLVRAKGNAARGVALPHALSGLKASEDR